MKYILFILIAILFNLESINSQSLINGDFDFGSLDYWISSGNLIIFSYGGSSSCCVPSQGNYALNFNGGNAVVNGSIQQSFSTIKGAIYSLSFDFGKGGDGNGIASLIFEICGKNVILNKTVSDGTGGYPGAYQRFHYTFTADTTIAILNVIDNSNGTISFDALLDNVLIENETGSTFNDIDGNQYPKLQIGNQTWMGENLRTSRYNDGELIPELSADHDWQNSNSGAYSWYNNDSVKYDTTYGKLYNWHTVNTSKLCPQGWHVPYAAEWQELYNFLGGDSLAGGTLKQMGFSDWNLPNTGATDSIGFTALPEGYRTANGAFSPHGSHGKWW